VTLILSDGTKLPENLRAFIGKPQDAERGDCCGENNPNRKAPLKLIL
jgi:hypothetical protein